MSSVLEKVNNSIYDILDSAYADNLSYHFDYGIGFIRNLPDWEVERFNERLVRKLIEDGYLINIIPKDSSMSMIGWYKVGLTPKGEEMLNAFA